MNLPYGVVAILVFTPAVWSMATEISLQCKYPLPDIPKQWIRMADPCVKGINKLINIEMSNSIQYLALAAYYFRDDVNRPGYGDMFVDSCHGKRAHAIDLIDYLTMRGQNTQGNLFKITPYYPPQTTSWKSLTEALEFVLNLEAKTTEQYLNTIAVCEKGCSFDDYHFVNWASQNFLEDLYNDQKYYADVASSLKKMVAEHKELGEFLSNINLQATNGDFDDDDDDDDEEC